MPGTSRDTSQLWVNAQPKVGEALPWMQVVLLLPSGCCEAQQKGIANWLTRIGRTGATSFKNRWPFRSEPLSSFILEFLFTYYCATSISPVPVDHGFRAVEDFEGASDSRRGKEPVSVRLGRLGKGSATTSCSSAWPLRKVVMIMHKPLRKRSLYVFLSFGIIYLELGWVLFFFLGSFVLFFKHAHTCVGCSHVLFEFQRDGPTAGNFTRKHLVPSDLQLNPSLSLCPDIS